MIARNKSVPQQQPRTTLKMVAQRVGLTPGTVSAVLNNTRACRSVPQSTKDLIFAAARELNYKPDFWARALRLKRTYTIGVIAAEIGDPYGSLIIRGIERYLRDKDFFFLTTVHRHDREVLEKHCRLLVERGAEGFITIDTSVTESPQLPTVAVAGHQPVKGVTNITVDHYTAVRSVLQHLVELGHREIAFMKGPATSSDTEDRWTSIVTVARELGLRMQPDLVVELNNPEGNAATTPEYGYPFAEELLARGRAFTAVFGYNDNSAIAAMRVLQDAGIRVPDDVSVVGFDDIQAASFTRPMLTTVKQPLERMGEIAARTVVDQIEGRGEYVAQIAIAPVLVVRKSTAEPNAGGWHAATRIHAASTSTVN